ARFADAAQHFAQRTPGTAAEHVRADVDAKTLLLVARAAPAHAAVFLEQGGLNARVLQKERRRRPADAGADDDRPRHAARSSRSTGGERSASPHQPTNRRVSKRPFSSVILPMLRTTTGVCLRRCVRRTSKSACSGTAGSSCVTSW